MEFVIWTNRESWAELIAYGIRSEFNVYAMVNDRGEGVEGRYEILLPSSVRPIDLRVSRAYAVGVLDGIGRTYENKINSGWQRPDFSVKGE